jgi:hypothetical protein
MGVEIRCALGIYLFFHSAVYNHKCHYQYEEIAAFDNHCPLVNAGKTAFRNLQTRGTFIASFTSEK